MKKVLISVLALLLIVVSTTPAPTRAQGEQSVLVVAAVAPEGWGFMVMPSENTSYRGELFVHVDGFDEKLKTQGAVLPELPPGGSLIAVGPWHPAELGAGWSVFSVEVAGDGLAAQVSWPFFLPAGNLSQHPLQAKQGTDAQAVMEAVSATKAGAGPLTPFGEQILEAFRYLGLNPTYMVGVNPAKGGLTYGIDNAIWVLDGVLDGNDRIAPVDGMGPVWTPWERTARIKLFGNRFYGEFSPRCWGNCRWQDN